MNTQSGEQTNHALRDAQRDFRKLAVLTKGRPGRL